MEPLSRSSRISCVEHYRTLIKALKDPLYIENRTLQGIVNPGIIQVPMLSVAALHSSHLVCFAGGCLEFPKIRGTLFWGPYKDPTTWGTTPGFTGFFCSRPYYGARILGSPRFRTPISGTHRPRTHAHTHTHTHRQRQRNTLKTPKHPKSIQNQSKHTPNTLRTRFNSGVLRFSSSVSASSLRGPGADLAGLLVQGLRV